MDVVEPCGLKIAYRRAGSGEALALLHGGFGFDNRAPTQPEHVRAGRTVLNMHWPPHPTSFTTRRPGIPVRVRIVWEHDGEQFVDGTATRWDADHVHVQLQDTARLQGNGVWVKPADVYRASPEPRDDVRLR